jgi:hypothetical protein
MRQTAIRTLLGFGLIFLALTPAKAADKEQRQLMADIRMLQEQSQQLQNLIGSLNAALTEALKAVNARLDEQANATRKGLADQKLIIDNLSTDLRIVREKVDDNNVRISSLSQEVDALRQAVQQQAPRVGAAPEAALDPTAAAPPGAAIPDAGAAPAVPVGLLRLHGGPVGPGHPGIRVLHPILSEVRSCRRRPSPDWQFVSAGWKERQGGRSVR